MIRSDQMRKIVEIFLICVPHEDQARVLQE